MRREDDLDVRLMKEFASPGSFQWNVSESYSSIARKLGVDDETVRRRLKLAKENGILQGFHLIPNPHLLNMESAALELEVGAGRKKSLVISQIELIEGVTLIVDFHGERLRTVIYYENDRSLSRKIQLIYSICGGSSERHWTERFPPCDLRTSLTDWSILKVMRKDARQNLSKVAKQIGVSTRTVKRRLTVMTQNNAFYLMPISAYQKSAVLACSFTVRCQDRSRKRFVDGKIKSSLVRMVFSNTSADEYSVFTVLCNNMSEAETTRETISGINGVESVVFGVVRKVIFVPEWLDEQVERRIRYPHGILDMKEREKTVSPKWMSSDYARKKLGTQIRFNATTITEGKRQCNKRRI